jgi:hypothetical protein
LFLGFFIGTCLFLGLFPFTLFLPFEKHLCNIPYASNVFANRMNEDAALPVLEKGPGWKSMENRFQTSLTAKSIKALQQVCALVALPHEL